jgi:hypothetical protein
MSFMGSKAGAGVYHQIIGLMPPHDFYCEPFVGSGAILALKEPAAHSVALDKNAMTIGLLKAWLAEQGTPAEAINLELIHGDALAWLGTFNPAGKGRVLIYADPPYLHSTRTSTKRYAHELQDADHVALAAVLLRLADQGCAVMVSGYPSPLYDALFVGWNTLEFPAMTRGGPRIEKVWFNFEPGASHFPTFAGKDRTDRQRIKRKAERWAANYANLPPAERQAILAALMAISRDPA